jgi:hypothetical protein
VPEDRNHSLSDPRARCLDQLVEVGDELLDGHRGSGDLAVEGLAAAALVPVDDGEGPLQRRIEVTEEVRLGETWPPVQEDQRRIGEPFAANHHPLIEPAEMEIVDLCDAARDALTGWPAERTCRSQMFHRSPRV